jgi:hypothetical protein
MIYFATGRDPHCLRLRPADYAALCKERFNSMPLLPGVPVEFKKGRFATVIANDPHLDFPVLTF